MTGYCVACSRPSGSELCGLCEDAQLRDEARTDEQADTDDFLAALIAAGEPADDELVTT